MNKGKTTHASAADPEIVEWTQENDAMRRKALLDLVDEPPIVPIGESRNADTIRDISQHH